MVERELWLVDEQIEEQGRKEKKERKDASEKVEGHLLAEVVHSHSRPHESLTVLFLLKLTLKSAFLFDSCKWSYGILVALTQKCICRCRHVCLNIVKREAKDSYTRVAHRCCFLFKGYFLSLTRSLLYYL